MIAALFVDPRGVYANLPDVEVWDEKRDARFYPGPWPVVAHPPCARWCQLAGLVQHRWGCRKGDDGGCFEAALRSVRTFGGVLEHPAYSAAFYTYGLPVPLQGGWIRGFDGGWSCHVEQWHYGHRAKKATWLYAHGIRLLPSLKWVRRKRKAEVYVSWCGNHIRDGVERLRLGHKEAAATPIAFRDVLLDMARSVAQREAAAVGR